MKPSRGDRKPCSVKGCGGTMQFGRRRQNGSGSSTAPKPSPAALDDAGWFCSSDADHFLEVSVGHGVLAAAGARTTS